MSKQSSVSISNPQNGKTYTSQKAARALVDRGRAAWEPGGRAIWLLPEVAERARADLERIEAGRVDEEIRRSRGGVVWWNGADPREGAHHRPGEVRS